MLSGDQWPCCCSIQLVSCVWVRVLTITHTPHLCGRVRAETWVCRLNIHPLILFNIELQKAWAQLVNYSMWPSFCPGVPAKEGRGAGWKRILSRKGIECWRDMWLCIGENVVACLALPSLALLCPYTVAFWHVGFSQSFPSSLCPPSHCAAQKEDLIVVCPLLDFFLPTRTHMSEIPAKGMAPIGVKLCQQLYI